MIKLGLIGCGSWGKNYLATIEQMEGVEVSAVWTKDKGPRSLQSIDGVIIATPPDTHAELALRALETYRIPVLLEKPATLDLQSTQKVLQAAEATGVPLLVNHIQLFSEPFLELRRLAREMGNFTVSSLAGNTGPFRKYSSLWDWGPHDVSMCLSLFDQPPNQHLTTAVRYTADSGGVVDVVNLVFGSDTTATLKFGNGLRKKVRHFTVKFESHGGEIVYEDCSFTPLRVNGIAVGVEREPPLQNVVEAFVKGIQTGETDWRWSPYLVEETARILTLVDKITVAS